MWRGQGKGRGGGSDICRAYLADLPLREPRVWCHSSPCDCASATHGDDCCAPLAASAPSPHPTDHTPKGPAIRRCRTCQWSPGILRDRRRDAVVGVVDLPNRRGVGAWNYPAWFLPPTPSVGRGQRKEGRRGKEESVEVIKDQAAHSCGDKEGERTGRWEHCRRTG